MSPRKKLVPNARPLFMVPFDPAHVYTDSEVEELTRNQKRKYYKHMGLARDLDAAVSKTLPTEEVFEERGNEDEVGDPDKDVGGVAEDVEARGGSEVEMLDRPEDPEVQAASGWRK